jgi:hypothetical protein
MKTFSSHIFNFSGSFLTIDTHYYALAHSQEKITTGGSFPAGKVAAA